MKLHPLHPATWVLDRLAEHGWHIHDLVSFTRSSTLVLAARSHDEPVVVKCGFGSNHVLAALDDADRRAAYGFYWYQQMTPAERTLSRDDFRHERELTRACTGTNGLVPLLDHGTCTDFDWYTMPHYPDGNLGKHLNSASPRHQLSLLADVAAALTQLHGHGIVHRDVYQENILVDHRGTGLLTDLGAAYRIGTPRGPRRRGPEIHWPPEYATNYHTATPAADVYSLAVLTYRVLFNDIPRLAGPSIAATAPQDLTDHVCGALTHDPAARPTMPELHAALRSAAAGMPVDLPTRGRKELSDKTDHQDKAQRQPTTRKGSP